MAVLSDDCSSLHPSLQSRLLLPFFFPSYSSKKLRALLIAVVISCKAVKSSLVPASCSSYSLLLTFPLFWKVSLADPSSLYL